ncbi:hypothetical protein HHK36_000642 [Tetracentron sinense]|uniref:Knottins-like domain-containing protein n=1 Tax=Tetracentron sinense TaxID=13715 RepID=A0A834ZRX5_TETSI|nr:hypothetical protein HHK36_000642 [Tetracentron sinense]
MERRFMGYVLLMIFLVIASQEVVLQVDARLCESQSHGFKGRCLLDSNCSLVCRNEGFSGGKCRGFRQRCFCTKPSMAGSAEAASAGASGRTEDGPIDDGGCPPP